MKYELWGSFAVAAELRLKLLGEPEISQNNQALTGFISAKAEGLLYYLAVTGQPRSRDLLAGMFWGEMPEAAARRNLTKALSNLRQLAGDHLLINHHSAAFNQASSYWLDAELLQSALESTDQATELETLQQAVDGYRTDFLAGFYVKEALPFEEWVLEQRARYRDLVLRGLERLINLLATHQAYDLALDYCHRLLSLDPYRETGCQQMMRLLAHSQQRHAALAYYETFCRLLAEDLGTEPLAETRLLYERLKTAGISPPHNLPHHATPFIGRESELAKIVTLLQDPGCRLVTLAGPGGTGKTRLALESATYYLQTETIDRSQPFPDGIYLVRLAPLDSAQAILSTLAEAIGFSFHKDGQAQQQLFSYLRQKALLLILDNVEHLLVSPENPYQASGFIVKLLESGANLKVLATSRTRLNVQGEHVFYLAGMDYPDWQSPLEPAIRPAAGWQPQAIAKYDAIQLFLQGARRVNLDFALTPTNSREIVHICQLVQGMPLGILLAAAWLEMLTPAEIAREIGHSLDFLETDMPDVPLRQRSLRAVFDHTWHLLSQTEREIFQQLAIFRGHFSPKAAQFVSGASLRQLMTLVNKSLLRQAATGRFTVHEMLRQFAVEKLEQDPAAALAARDRHCTYYTTLLQRQLAHFYGPHQPTALAEVEADSENIRIAWRWAIGHDRVPQFDQAVDCLGWFYTWRGRYQEGEAAFRLAAEKLAAGNEAGPNYQVLVKTLAWQGVLNHKLGLTGQAGRLLRQSLSLLAQPGFVDFDPGPINAFIYLHLGDLSRETDRLAARHWYEQSLALYQTLGDRWGAANALAALGWLVQHLGAYSEAKQIYQESLTIRQQLADQRGIASSLKLLGGVLLYQGQADQAETLIRQSITLSQVLKDQVGVAGSLSKLGETLILQGKFNEALAPLQESQLIFDHLGIRDAGLFASVMQNLARMHLGQYAIAHSRTELGLTLFRELGSQRGIAYTLLALGSLSLAGEALVEAERYLQESLAIYRHIGQRDELGQNLALLGYVAYRQGDLAQARRYVGNALQVAAEIQAINPLLLALAVCAMLTLEQRGPERAGDYFSLLRRYPLVNHSAWFARLTVDRLNSADPAPNRPITIETAVAEILRDFAG
jgi:predicted ATPase/DNA-binding SARP family transcriptional activator